MIHLQVFFALILASIGVSQTSAMASDSTKAKVSALSIFALLDRKSEIDSSSNEGLTLDEVKGNIDFRHVSFKYPTRPDIQIFSDFTLHIPSGKVSLLLITSLYLPVSCKQNLTFVMVLYRLLHLLERVVAASQQ
jgi:ATP-binding cassette subfamily B (MDR/TAP) protein 1